MFRVYIYSLSLLTIAFFTPSFVLQAKAGQINGNDVVINGESFFAASNIRSELTRLARRDGYINQNESFRQIAVSGASISQILGFYNSCNPKPKYLITDGGGIDMMGDCGSNPTKDCSVIQSALNTMQQYITSMRENGTKKFLYMRYPDPQGGFYANLKANHDVFMPEVEKLCKASSDPECLWVDLRPVWEGHYSEYTSDGIHCTNAGGTATAEAFWKAIKESNFFDLEVPVTYHITKSTPTPILSHITGNRNLVVTTELDKPSKVSLQILTISGRSVLTAEQQSTGSGLQRIIFPLGTITPGTYICNARAGQNNSGTILLVP